MDITKRDFIKYTTAVIITPVIPNLIVPTSATEVKQQIYDSKSFTSDLCKWMVEYMEQPGEKTEIGISNHIDERFGRSLRFEYSIVNNTATCLMPNNIIECYPESEIESRNKNMQKYIDYISVYEEKKKLSMEAANKVTKVYIERQSIDIEEVLKNV